MGKQGSGLRVRLRWDFDGGAVDAMGFIVRQLVEVGEVFRCTDLMQVNSSIRWARAMHKSASTGFPKVTSRGDMGTPTGEGSKFVFKDNAFALPIQFIPFGLCILAKAAPLVSIQPRATKTMEVGRKNIIMLVEIDVVSVRVHVLV